MLLGSPARFKYELTLLFVHFGLQFEGWVPADRDFAVDSRIKWLKPAFVLFALLPQLIGPVAKHDPFVVADGDRKSTRLNSIHT